MRTVFVIALLVAAVLATSALGATPPVKHAKVNDVGFQFQPHTLTIKRGTKVVWNWVNPGGVPHNVTVLHGPVKFHSATKASGSFSHLFRKPGKYVLYCTIHATMREVVIVK